MPVFPVPVEFHIYKVVLRIESIVSHGSVVDFLKSLVDISIVRLCLLV